MSTLKYCDGHGGECRNDENEHKLYSPNDFKVAQKLVDKVWAWSVYDLHFCEDCIANYYNEADEQLAINNDGYIILGKDFTENYKRKVN